MRDRGLDVAIRAAGGVTELARRIGIAQPSVSKWDRVPAERVASVEHATGVSRVILRPDLFAESRTSGLDEIDAERARYYELLATLLARAPSTAFLARLAEVRGDATPLGVALTALAQAAAGGDVSSIEREYFELFIGLGRGEFLPYASYYQSGFLNERPLARLRSDLVAFGIERAESNHEPEDHAATLCEIMAGLVARRFPAPENADRDLFIRHIEPWMGRLFADMARADSAKFYRHVGALGSLFLDIEAEAFTLAE
ncbi:MAG: molecular chaperone TorD family protein [Hyphomicrobiaceae bacterium]